MSNYSKFLISTILITSGLLSQSLVNGYGLGKKIIVQDAASFGISSTGLLPGYNKNVSLQNPSTWHNLNFTYFSGSYNYNQNTILSDLENGKSFIGVAQFIVPIKNKYALSIGIRPYTDQQLDFEGDTESSFIAYSDTFTTSHSFSSYGGITAFNLSVAGKVNNNLNAGMALDFLYGSARQQTVFSANDLNYYTQRRNIYSGSLAKLYFNTNVLSQWNIPINLYAGFGFPLKNISVESYDYKPFEDSNNSGSQDSYDFPTIINASDPVVTNTKNISAPIEYQVGFDYSINKNIGILGEYSRWEDNRNDGLDFSILKDQISFIDHYSIGIMKFSPNIRKSFMDRVNFKFGAYSDNIQLVQSEKNIKEYGVSMGLSFNFGFTKNQIDIGYSIGKRKDLIDIGEENIQKFSVGITVGDLWFVKRRAQ